MRGVVASEASKNVRRDAMPRIGYAPISHDYDAPGDRRRFCFYARKRGISFEKADPAESYDLVIVTLGADLSRWARYDRGPIIFDFVDPYLAETGPRSRLRGPAKFAARQSRYLHVSYKELLKTLCRRSAGVICGTREQQEAIRPLCRNVHVILDFHADAVRNIKADYSAGNVFNLVWEGFAGNISTFESAVEALRTFQERRTMALHLVTNIERPVALRTFGRLPTKRLVRRVLTGIRNVYLYEWNEELFSSICTACDLAIIPIPLDEPMFAAKSENKLVSFWRMGLPVVTSATTAYTDAMRAAGLSMACRTAKDWIRMLGRYAADENLRREAGCAGRNHAQAHYGEERLLAQWDRFLESLDVGVRRRVG